MGVSRRKKKLVKRRSFPNGRQVSSRVWSRWSDQRLLDMRICDLGLRIGSTPLEKPIQRLRSELERRHLRFCPHFWLGEEWFSPDGVPGVAIPFYLAHPRLARLERSQMRELEDGSQGSVQRILRHEVGHAVDHAYLLHRRRRWQQFFGRSSQSYPDTYMPRPWSRRYVQHLDFWYAQSHPDEDFAETFAVWLGPRAVWRKRYRGWHALKKLEYVDELMAEIAGQSPLVRSRAKCEPVSQIRRTLREHYEEKRARYGEAYPDRYDHDLRELFSDQPRHRKRESAAAFIRRNSPDFRRQIARWSGDHHYTVNFVLKEMIGRCRELSLHLRGHEKQARIDFLILLAIHTMNHFYRGRRRMAM